MIAGILLLGLLCVLATGCGSGQAAMRPEQPAPARTAAQTTAVPSAESTPISTLAQSSVPIPTPTPAPIPMPPVSKEPEASPEEPTMVPGSSIAAFDYGTVPPFTGSAFAAINDNVPFFQENEIMTEAFESYSPMDGLGRCGIAWACIGTETMPTQERGDISSITPSGWNQVQCDGVDGGWLYNRCHLIGYQLAGEDANASNLITGTRFFNIQGMVPFENMVADYVQETGNHVMYRATPVFVGNELVCRGVILEGMSVEDGGEDILFNVFCYNVQPGIEIDYATGASSGSGIAVSTEDPPAVSEPEATPEPVVEPVHSPYVGNRNTGKFHRSDCSSVDDMADKNKVALSSAAEAQANGFVPCKRCKP